MGALPFLAALLVGQASAGFTSVDDWVISGLSNDSLNRVGIPEYVHMALIRTIDMKEPGRELLLKRHDSLARSAFANLSEARKSAARFQVFRMLGVRCLRFIEIHDMLRTTPDQRREMPVIIQRLDLQSTGYRSNVRDQIRAQCNTMNDSLDLGKKLRDLLTASQRKTLAKLLGGDGYLTSATGVYIDNQRFRYDGDLREPSIRAALGFSSAQSKEIGETYQALALLVDGQGMRYMDDLERGLSAAQSKRYEELKLQAKGALAILGSEVGSKIGMSAEQLEDIYRETIQLSGDRIIEGTELYPLRSTPVGEDIDVTIRHNNDVTRFEGETYVLLEKVILDKLTAVQRSRWLKLQGKPDPEVTRAAKMKRILSGHGDR